MAKKRKCRYTAEERAIHEEAVRLRKMTDRQLVEEFRRRQGKEDAIGVPDAPVEADFETESGENTTDIEQLLTGLSEGKCKGIKGATAYKIRAFAEEMGLI